MKRIEENEDEESEFSVLRLRMNDKPVVFISYGELCIISIYLQDKRAELMDCISGIRGFVYGTKEMKPVFEALMRENYVFFVEGTSSRFREKSV